MFGPTSWAFLGVLIAGFAGFLYWLTRSQHIAVKAGGSAYSDLAVMNKVFGAGSTAITDNDPSTLVTGAQSSLPRFWIMSGSGNAVDTVAAQDFREIVTTREPIEYVVLPGGNHTPPAWRAALPPLLRWTWHTISGGPVGVGTSQLSPGSRA